jgi:hypothetical protein
MAENTTKVVCTVPNGVALRLFTTFEGANYPVGETVMLSGPRSPANDFDPGQHATEVDSDFWAEWLKQNKTNPLLTGKQIYVEEPAKEKGAADGDA